MSDYNNYIEKAENYTLPVIVLNGTVAFPSVNINFEISEKKSVAAAKAAPTSPTTIPTMMPMTAQRRNRVNALRLSRKKANFLLVMLLSEFIFCCPYCGGIISDELYYSRICQNINSVMDRIDYE